MYIVYSTSLLIVTFVFNDKFSGFMGFYDNENS